MITFLQDILCVHYFFITVRYCWMGHFFLHITFKLVQKLALDFLAVFLRHNNLRVRSSLENINAVILLI